MMPYFQEEKHVALGKMGFISLRRSFLRYYSPLYAISPNFLPIEGPERVS